MSQTQGFRLGFLTGLRSMATLSVLAHYASKNPSGSNLPDLLKLPQVATLLKVAAVGEIIGDKIPFIPNRTAQQPLFGRVIIGGFIGGVLDADDRFRGAIYGALGAVVGSYIGMIIRRRIGRLYGIPDPILALIEDGITYALAREWVTNPTT